MSTKLVLTIDRGDADELHCGTCPWAKDVGYAMGCWRFPWESGIGYEPKSLPYETLEEDAGGLLRTDSCLQGEFDGWCSACQQRCNAKTDKPAERGQGEVT